MHEYFNDCLYNCRIVNTITVRLSIMLPAVRFEYLYSDEGPDLTR